MSARPSVLLFEAANPRHAHEVDIFRQLQHLIPQDKILVPGVIDSTSNYIEHPKLVAKRLIEFSKIVGKERWEDPVRLNFSRCRVSCSGYRQAQTVVSQHLESCQLSTQILSE